MRRISSGEEAPLDSLDAPLDSLDAPPGIDRLGSYVERGGRKEAVDAPPTVNSMGGRREGGVGGWEGEGVGLPFGGRQSAGYSSVADLI